MAETRRQLWPPRPKPGLARQWSGRALGAGGACGTLGGLGDASVPRPPEARLAQCPPSPCRSDPFRAGPDGRGRSALPRRRPTYYTVTAPEPCCARPALTPRAACHSCSEDSGSEASSLSHPTPPGSSSPDISFLRPLSPPAPSRPPRGPAGPRPRPPPACLRATRYVVLAEGCPPPAQWAEWGLGCGEDVGPPRWQRPPPAHSRVARTPSLRDHPAGRGLSKAAVSEELKSWHERARLRSARPHSLDRQGAFRVRSLPPGADSFVRAPAPRGQVRALARLSGSCGPGSPSAEPRAGSPGARQPSARKNSP